MPEIFQVFKKSLKPFAVLHLKKSLTLIFCKPLIHFLPTFCWAGSSDRALHLQCFAGAALSAMALLGIAQAPALFLAWLLYLSLSTVCREFLSFQWDTLLLETGLLAAFFAPARIRFWRKAWPRLRLPSPSPAAVRDRPSRPVAWDRTRNGRDGS